MTSEQIYRPVRVTYTAGDFDQQQGYTKMLHRRDAKRNSPLKTLGTLALIVLYVIPVMAFITTTRDVPIAITLYIAFAPWIVGFAISKWDARRAKSAFLADTEWVEFQLGEDALRYRAAWYESMIAWSAVAAATHYRAQFVLELKNGTRLFVPTHSFDDGAHASAWLSEAQSRIKAPEAVAP